MTEEQWKILYQRAVFAELTANEGCLDTENGLDFSINGLAEKQNIEALPALMQQCILLCCKEGATLETEISLEEALTNIHALKNAKSTTFKSPDPVYDNWIEEFSKFVVLPETRKEIEVASAFYEGFLASVPVVTTTAPTTTTTRGATKIPSTTMGKGPVEPPKESITIENDNQSEGKSKGEFVTAGQMLGRPAPIPRPTATVPPRKPVGLSKRLKIEAPKPNNLDGGGLEETESPSLGGVKDGGGDPRLKGIDPKLLETIQNEIIHRVDTVTWEQIAGLEHAKNTIKEIVIWPMLRPDIFTGLRGPPKGLLLFGPPGTGKTMIGKCIASQAQATFFSISASSLTSKWVGEGEKLVRALFACARALQPSVVFIDEIDSLLTQRTDGEFEASRRIKTEFLVQFDGAATCSSDRILIIGATNRPQELDEAARRRLVKRLYIPLPEESARATIIKTLLTSQQHHLNENDISEICQKTFGYSGADVDNLCREAALGPIRSIDNILSITADQVRPIVMNDFIDAMRQVRASVSSTDLEMYLDWNSKFGSLAV